MGRIINRFSKDISRVDTVLMPMVKMFIQSLFQLIGCLLVIAVVTPLFIIAIIPMLIIYFIIARYYLPTSRELKRLDSIFRSRMFN